ncbi:GL26514 [Drosophila persimilis]|uniref:GL26514 n=1 Tax=Drosophila persimilis TaxID=7234 RepID=B4GSD2_DROPE|nr:GL26514 [Drosophila persimilis]
MTQDFCQLVIKFVASVEQGLEVARDNKLESSMDKSANHDAAGDSKDMEYQRFDASTGCGVPLEKEVKKHCKVISIFYQKRAVWHVVHKNWPMVKGDSVKALKYDCRNGIVYLRRARAHDATGDLREFLIDFGPRD